MYRKDPPECTKKTLTIRRGIYLHKYPLEKKNMLGLKEHFVRTLPGVKVN
jgi:hypothetical protein